MNTVGWASTLTAVGWSVTLLWGCGGSSLPSDPRALDSLCEADQVAACRQWAQAVLSDAQADASSQAQARRRLARACNKGDARGCTLWGQALHEGIGGASDSEAALKLLRRGCQLGDAPGCNRAGAALWSLAKRKGQEPPASSLSLFERACSLGSASGCGNEGLWRVVTGEDAARGRALLEEACERGEAGACHQLGYVLLEGLGAERTDRQGAEARWRSACEADVMASCADLGVLREQEGASEKASRLYRRACRGGLALACGRLAANSSGKAAQEAAERGCRAQDRGSCARWASTMRGRLDAAAAHRLRERACLVASDAACAAMGVAGPNRVLTLAEASVGPGARLKQQCARGHGLSCVLVGIAQEEGVAGLAQDRVQAMRRYREGCQAGQALGCRRLGAAHLAGSVARALKHWQRGCDLGDGASCAQWAALRLRAPGSLRDEQAGRAQLEASCRPRSQGVPAVGLACLYLGELQQRGGAPLEAARDYERGCALGEARACGRAGYLKLRGAVRGRQQAQRYYEAGCRADDGYSCMGVGRLWLEAGQLSKAAHHFERACRGSHIAACTSLGVMALEGHTATPRRGRELLGMSCTRGHALGCRNLALDKWHRGQRQAARELWQRGCSLSDSKSCAMVRQLSP